MIRRPQPCASKDGRRERGVPVALRGGRSSHRRYRRGPCLPPSSQLRPLPAAWPLSRPLARGQLPWEARGRPVSAQLLEVPSAAPTPAPVGFGGLGASLEPPALLDPAIPRDPEGQWPPGLGAPQRETLSPQLPPPQDQSQPRSAVARGRPRLCCSAACFVRGSTRIHLPERILANPGSVRACAAPPAASSPGQVHPARAWRSPAWFPQVCLSRQGPSSQLQKTGRWRLLFGPGLR